LSAANFSTGFVLFSGIDNFRTNPNFCQHYFRTSNKRRAGAEEEGLPADDYFMPHNGNVVFASAIHGWGFAARRAGQEGKK